MPYGVYLARCTSCHQHAPLRPMEVTLHARRRRRPGRCGNTPQGSDTMDTTQGIQRSTAERAHVRPGRHRPSPKQPDPDPDFPVSLGPNLYAIVLVDVVASARATSEGLYRLRESLYDLVDRALKRRGLRLSSIPLD